MLYNLFSPSRVDEIEGQLQMINAGRSQEANNRRWLIERIETLEKRVAELEKK